MTTTSKIWLSQAADIAGHDIITDAYNGPQVVYSQMAMPDAARGYLARRTADEFSSAVLRSRSAGSPYFDVRGWHKDPAKSGASIDQTATILRRLLPDDHGRDELASHLGHTYALLASAWDREKLCLEFRGYYHAKGDKPHVDYGSEYDAIYNLTNVSTLFAPPESYRGQVPHIYTPEGADGNLRCEYRMTPEMKEALVGLPLEVLASWRGSVSPAVHVTPEFTGTRIISMAATTPQNRMPALG